jgi:hypothetical protein
MSNMFLRFRQVIDFKLQTLGNDGVQLWNSARIEPIRFLNKVGRLYEFLLVEAFSKFAPCLPQSLKRVQYLSNLSSGPGPRKPGAIQ